MEETMKKPRAVKAATTITLISTICGFCLSIVSFILFLGISKEIGSSFADRRYVLSVALTLIVWAVSFAFNFIGFSSGIMLWKNRKRGRGLAMLWAIASIVISLIAAIPSFILFFNLPAHSSGTLSDMASSLNLMIMSTAWQWNLGVIVLILLSLKPVKAFFSARASIDGTPVASDRETQTITPVSVPPQDELQSQKVEELQKPRIAKTAATIIQISSVCGFLIAIIPFIFLIGTAIDIRGALNRTDVVHLVTALAITFGSLICNPLGFAGGKLLRQGRKLGLRLSRFWASAMIAIGLIYVIYFVIFFKMELEPVQSSIESNSASLNVAFFTSLLDAFWQWVPALVVIILLSLRPVKKYFKAQK